MPAAKNKSRSKTARKKNASKKGVTRKKPTKKQGRSNANDINPLQHVEFRVIARLAIAVAFAGGLYWLAGVQVDQPTESQPSNTSSSRPTPANLSGLSYDDFIFYSELKEFEVKVAEDNPYTQAEEQNIVYLIQAGAFKTHERAEEHLVQLMLIDLEPRIEQQGAWYRVLIGPLDSRSKMSAVRNRLIENGMQAQVMKQKAN